MTKVFVGGSRKVSRLSADVRRRIDRIIEKRMSTLVGDANGADKAVQAYLQSKAYPSVEVFCSGDECRNNLGRWPERHVSVPAARKSKDRSFYTVKDRAMSEAAGFGLMIWDGESVGTLLNVLRLLRQEKKVVVYLGREKRFAELRDTNDWNAFAESCPLDLRARVEDEATLELAAAGASAPFSRQGTMF